jgi:hypothetical protein
MAEADFEPGTILVKCLAEHQYYHHYEPGRMRPYFFGPDTEYRIPAEIAAALLRDHPAKFTRVTEGE